MNTDNVSKASMQKPIEQPLLLQALNENETMLGDFDDSLGQINYSIDRLRNIASRIQVDSLADQPVNSAKDEADPEQVVNDFTTALYKINGGYRSMARRAYRMASALSRVVNALDKQV